LKGDLGSALDSYRKAAELAPSEPKIAAMVAYLETLTGQNEAAIRNLRKQLAINPEDATAMNNLAFVLAETGGELDRALSLAETAYRKFPNNPGMADTLGWVYVKKGLNDSAIQIFSGLVKKYPEEPSLRYHFGVALLQKGKLPEAKAELVMGLSKKPSKDLAERMKDMVAKIG
jgi:Flp pilus assembly protein TadD